MEAAQLRNLAARVEGRDNRDDWRDLVEGAGGAARVLAALFAPHRRAAAWLLATCLALASTAASARLVGFYAPGSPVDGFFCIDRGAPVFRNVP